MTTKQNKWSKHTHKCIKKTGKSCDGCYACAGIKTARYSKRELGVLNEKLW
jgi:hypothetical protein